MTDERRNERPLPVVEEELRVGREQVETGAVRVRVRSVQGHEPLRLDMVSELVDVERVPVGQPVAQRREPWHDGETLVVPVYEEKVVLQRTLVLKEEVRLRRRQERRTEDRVAVVRRDTVVTERRNGDGTWSVIDDTAAQESSAQTDLSRKEST